MNGKFHSVLINVRRQTTEHFLTLEFFVHVYWLETQQPSGKVLKIKCAGRVKRMDEPEKKHTHTHKPILSSRVL